MSGGMPDMTSLPLDEVAVCAKISIDEKVLPAVEIYKKDSLYDTETRLSPDKVERGCPVRSDSIEHYEAEVEEIREIIDTCALEVLKLMVVAT